MTDATNLEQLAKHYSTQVSIVLHIVETAIHGAKNWIWNLMDRFMSSAEARSNLELASILAAIAS